MRRMRSRVLRLVPLAVALLAFPTRQGAGQGFTYSFDGHAFSLQLPPGYRFQGEASPMPGFKTFAFATDPRPDGTRGLIQVSLVDLTQIGSTERPTLDRVTRSMVDAVRRRRRQWKEAESSVEVAGVPARRVEWSGSNEPSPERPRSQTPSMMRGVMIVGIGGALAFALHTQDAELFAGATVPKGELALMTFAFAREK